MRKRKKEKKMKKKSDVNGQFFVDDCDILIDPSNLNFSLRL